MLWAADSFFFIFIMFVNKIFFCYLSSLSPSLEQSPSSITCNHVHPVPLCYGLHLGLSFLSHFYTLKHFEELLKYSKMLQLYLHSLPSKVFRHLWCLMRGRKKSQGLPFLSLNPLTTLLLLSPFMATITDAAFLQTCLIFVTYLLQFEEDESQHSLRFACKALFQFLIKD